MSRFLFLIVGLLILIANGKARAQATPEPLLKKGDRIVFLGGTFADQMRVQGYLEAQLSARASDLNLTFRNLAWPGDTLTLQPRPLNFGSLEQHLTQQKADVIVACFGMSESFAGPKGVEKFERNWEAFLKRLQSKKFNGKTPPRIVMVSPIARELRDRRFGDVTRHNENLKLYVDAMQKIATKNKLRFVDLYQATSDLYEETKAEYLTKNGLHLNAYGYWAVSHFLADGLTKDYKPARVEVDVAAKKISATGAKASDLKVEENAITFGLGDIALSLPAPPEGAEVHRSLQKRRRMLILNNLKPGTYELKINGRSMVKAQSAQWENGVVIENDPAAQTVKQLRDLIQDKNELFFYRWRPSNSEYVIGRRTKPYGSVSFPPEMKKMDELIGEKEAEIRKLLSSPSKETWQIIRVSE